MGSWLPGGGDWGTGGWVSVTVIVVPGTVTVVPGIVTVVPGIVTTEPGVVIVTVSVNVQMVLLPPSPPGSLTDTVARPGFDGKTVVGGSREGGKEAVSVMVTGGGQP